MANFFSDTKDKMSELKNNPKNKKIWVTLSVVCGVGLLALIVGLTSSLKKTAAAGGNVNASALIETSTEATGTSLDSVAGSNAKDIDFETILGYDKDGQPIYGSYGLVPNVMGYDVNGQPIATGSITQTGSNEKGEAIYDYSSKEVAAAKGIDGKDGTNGTNGTNGTGSTGIAGTNGTNGTSGSTGATGASGKNGTNGTSGTGKNGVNGANGANGANGKNGTAGSYYVIDNYVKGDKGDTGANGIEGKQGPAGVAGAAGSNGANGKDGRDGQTGAAGIAGAKGDTGATGATGAAGAAGAPGKDGADGKSTFVRFSKNANGKDMTEIPDSTTKYMGVYTGTTASTKYTDYEWTQYKDLSITYDSGSNTLTIQ
jgi:hypothetical protein